MDLNDQIKIQRQDADRIKLLETDLEKLMTDVESFKNKSGPGPGN